MQSLFRVASPVALALFVAGPLAAQDGLFPRPKLSERADTNNWEAYFDRGRELLAKQPSRAEAAFYWAARINPERAEPLFARWVAFHMRDVGRFESYIQDDERVRRDPRVLAMDSLRFLSLIRNPFVHRGLEAMLWDRLPGFWGQDYVTKGWLAYATLDFPTALQYLGRSLSNKPKDIPRNRWILFTRAQAFVQLHLLDSALAQMLRLREEAQLQEQREKVVLYESKEVVDYAIARLQAARGNMGAAREFLGNALVENLAFYPAQLFLGDYAMAQRQWDDALRAYEDALASGARDAVLYYHHARALLVLNRPKEALASLQKAIELEPYYAEPWLQLARILEGGDPAAARVAYQRFLERAAQKDDNRVQVLKRIEALDKGN